MRTLECSTWNYGRNRGCSTWNYGTPGSRSKCSTWNGQQIQVRLCGEPSVLDVPRGTMLGLPSLGWWWRGLLNVPRGTDDLPLVSGPSGGARCSTWNGQQSQFAGGERRARWMFHVERCWDSPPSGDGGMASTPLVSRCSTWNGCRPFPPGTGPDVPRGTMLIIPLGWKGFLNVPRGTVSFLWCRGDRCSTWNIADSIPPWERV
jgi:hypothetical protein